MDDERSLLDAATGHLKAALAVLDDLNMPIAAARIDHALHEVSERSAREAAALGSVRSGG